MSKITFYTTKKVDNPLDTRGDYFYRKKAKQPISQTKHTDNRSSEKFSANYTIGGEGFSYVLEKFYHSVRCVYSVNQCNFNRDELFILEHVV